jgi:hypothetical protein
MAFVCQSIISFNANNVCPNLISQLWDSQFNAGVILNLIELRLEALGESGSVRGNAERSTF